MNPKIPRMITAPRSNRRRAARLARVKNTFDDKKHPWTLPEMLMRAIDLEDAEPKQYSSVTTASSTPTPTSWTG
jgi:hypothetical protein